MQTFLDEIWAVKHHHVKRCATGYFDRLLPGPSAVDQLLEHVAPEPSAVRLVRGGESKDAESFRLADGSLDSVRVRDAFAQGYTIVLNGLEQYVREIAALSHSIEVELNFPTRVNGYVTPPESTGFVPHFDPHDVLVLQMQGSKIWRLADVAAIPPHEMQRQQGAAEGFSLPTELCLEPGDVLYLPRGHVHAAQTHSQPSVHLTVGIHAPTVLTLITHALRALSLRDDRAHTRLPPRHLDDPCTRASLSALVHDIVRTIDDPSVIAEGLGTMAEVLVRRGRCPPVGQVADTVGVDEQTLVVKHQPLYSRVTRVDADVVLEFAQLSINAESDHEAAMLFLSRRTEPFRVGDLPGLSPVQQTKLARSLIATGFLSRLADNS